MEEQPSHEWIDQVNQEMDRGVLDYIRSGLEHFGVPRGTFADDQFDNFVAMYNRRGDMLNSLNGEISSLRDRIGTMEDVLVSIANWPNQEMDPQIQAMKVWSASVVDPQKVTMLKGLTTP